MSLFPSTQAVQPPNEYLVANIDGGARGNPGPAGFGVLIRDQSGKKIAALSEYLGHQTNNYAEYSGLIAALEYALQHGHKALKVISDSELMVKQMRGHYKVKSPGLLELYRHARELSQKLEWFSIQHVLRAQNRDADGLANAAMDKGMGRKVSSSSTSSAVLTRHSQEFQGVVRKGVVELENAELPEGTRVQIRVKKS
jgi:ribonuclease HI